MTEESDTRLGGSPGRLLHRAVGAMVHSNIYPITSIVGPQPRRQLTLQSAGPAQRRQGGLEDGEPGIQECRCLGVGLGLG